MKTENKTKEIAKHLEKTEKKIIENVKKKLEVVYGSELNITFRIQNYIRDLGYNVALTVRQDEHLKTLKEVLEDLENTYNEYEEEWDLTQRMTWRACINIIRDKIKKAEK
jgi:SPX domain protein involved in polyphosphate accumulation